MEIEGMTCNHCTESVRSALEEAGAANVIVSLEEKIATFESSAKDTKPFELAVEEQGYEVLALR
jgi:copper chaperone CopZ